MLGPPTKFRTMRSICFFFNFRPPANFEQFKTRRRWPISGGAHREKWVQDYCLNSGG